ncbi:hypothetical protein E2C01_056858 [Portunus trituberculatus]|uniref:Uncharacterized protein n=1 Tax=Portunus trituberculatus TaxID=210409 RepID=A0A5B7H0Q4_PORTR|nr:hypothetical protein [Portunus trituberculatus]
MYGEQQHPGSGSIHGLRDREAEDGKRRSIITKLIRPYFTQNINTALPRNTTTLYLGCKTHQLPRRHQNSATHHQNHCTSTLPGQEVLKTYRINQTDPEPQDTVFTARTIPHDPSTHHKPYEPLQRHKTASPQPLCLSLSPDSCQLSPEAYAPRRLLRLTLATLYL